MYEPDYSIYLPYLLLAGGAFLTGMACFYQPKKNKLKETGIAVDGIVFEQGSGSTALSFTDTGNQVNERVVIRFVTKDLQWITAPIKQDFTTFYTSQYKDGETVKVFYNPLNPSDFIVDTRQSELLTRIGIGVA